MSDKDDAMARKLTPQEYELLKEIREQTKASYCSIIAGIKKCGLDKESVINYLREIAIVYAQKAEIRVQKTSYLTRKRRLPKKRIPR